MFIFFLCMCSYVNEVRKYMRLEGGIGYIALPQLAVIHAKLILGNMPVCGISLGLHWYRPGTGTD